MTTTNSLRFGQHVESSDGHRLGRVDRILLADANHQVEGIVVHRLLGHQDKIVEIGNVARITGDTVSLSVDAAAAKELPDLVEQEYVTLSADQALHDSFQSIVPGTYGTFMATAPVAGRRTIEQTTAGLFDPAIPSGATVSESSNLPFGEDDIRRGTEVVGSDGKTLGKVHDVEYDASGALVAFVVKEGFIFHHDVRVPVSAVADVGDKRIRLNAPAESFGHSA